MSSLAHLLPADFARRHLRTGREMVRQERRRPAEERLATGVPGVDELLGGGLRRGALHELSGRRGGRFSIALAALAATTSAGEAAALVDLGDALDPQLAQDAGVVLERLLWVRPRKLKEALSSVEAILATAMPLIVLDLGLPPVPGGRGHEASWLRLARGAQDQRVALLVSSPYRVSATSAHAVLELRPENATWHGRGACPRLLGGLRGRLELVKGESAHGAEPRSVGWRAPSAVADPTEIAAKKKAAKKARKDTQKKDAPRKNAPKKNAQPHVAGESRPRTAASGSTSAAALRAIA